jgi:hypothetical protein
MTFIFGFGLRGGIAEDDIEKPFPVNLPLEIGEGGFLDCSSMYATISSAETSGISL